MTDYAISRTIILIAWIISWILFLYSIYYQFRENTITERQASFHLTIYSIISLSILYLLIYRKLDVYISTTSNYVIGLLWTLIVSLIFYMYLNVCGFWKAKSNMSYEIFIIFILIYLSLSGFGYFGLKIVINQYEYNGMRILYYNQFQSNSHKGVKFIGYNVFYLIIIYFISFLFERETE